MKRFVNYLFGFCMIGVTHFYVLHQWLFMVLIALGSPVGYRNITLHLYSLIFAHPSGCSDGSLLFQVLCGVKIGCPLSFGFVSSSCQTFCWFVWVVI